MEIYVNRLLEEWKQHGKIIIAVDFDDTICHWKLNDEITYASVIDLLKKARYTGAYIVIFTACGEDRYEEIRSYCHSSGLVIDGINTTPIKLPFGNNNKIYANIFIDDRAGINEAMAILEKAMYQYRGYEQKDKLTNLNEIA